MALRASDRHRSEHQMGADFQSKTELRFLVCLSLPLWCLILSQYQGADRSLVFILSGSSSKAGLLEQGSGGLSLGLVHGLREQGCARRANGIFRVMLTDSSSKQLENDYKINS